MKWGTKYRDEVSDLVSHGAEAIYVWGVTSDALIARERIDLLAKAVETAKEFGVASGVGAAFGSSISERL